MKVLLILLVGILIGANGVYYLMTRYRPAAPVAPAASAQVEPAAPAAPVTSPRPRAAPAPARYPAPIPAPSGLIVPVAGIAASQLVDTFTDARGTDRVHDSIDIMAARGTPVLAVADGHVEKLFTSEGGGGLTIYQFEPSGRYAYYYAHLDRYAADLAEGQALKQGDVIGYVGSTGNASPEGPHLHFAIFVLGPERQWSKGTAINPYPLLSGPQ
ncbi:MAG: M23 family metallopeptidase [Pseudomonadota bacterium]|nr:M23 family metallopeptidase [Pseudomonadota bacterium]